jgi:hypothetical protein
MVNETDPGDIDVTEIVNAVIERIFSRLVGGIILIGGGIGSAFTSVGDAVIAATVEPFGFVFGAVGGVGESLLDVIYGVDQLLVETANATGAIGSVALIVLYVGIAFGAVWVAVQILGLLRSVIPFL